MKSIKTKIEWYISSKSEENILIYWIPHWFTNSLDVLILHVSTFLILIGKHLSKYDSDAV